MPSELTTLQIARRIADAVVEEAIALDDGSTWGYNRSHDDSKDGPTQAVLRALHETGSWLCRWESELPPDTAEVKDDEPTLF